MRVPELSLTFTIISITIASWCMSPAASSAEYDHWRLMWPARPAGRRTGLVLCNYATHDLAVNLTPVDVNRPRTVNNMTIIMSIIVCTCVLQGRSQDFARREVTWHCGRTSVFGRRTFSVLRPTCSWRVTIYVGKPSAMGQPTRPTQPFIPSRSIDE